MGWSGVSAHIVQHNSRRRQIATVWHPEACGETLETGFGHVRVAVGPAQYQLTTGEVVPL